MTKPKSLLKTKSQRDKEDSLIKSTGKFPLATPFEVEGRTVKELDLDASKLKGEDTVNIEDEWRTRNGDLPTLPMHDPRFRLFVIARINRIDPDDIVANLSFSELQNLQIYGLIFLVN